MRYNCKASGAVAQLGERLHGMQEVGGSNPLRSTILEFDSNHTSGTLATGM